MNCQSRIRYSAGSWLPWFILTRFFWHDCHCVTNANAWLNWAVEFTVLHDAIHMRDTLLYHYQFLPWFIVCWICRSELVPWHTILWPPRTTIEFSVGGEFFHSVGQRVTIKGYTCIMPWLAVKENNLPQFTKGEKVKISKVDLYEVLNF